MFFFLHGFNHTTSNICWHIKWSNITETATENQENLIKKTRCTDYYNLNFSLYRLTSGPTSAWGLTRGAFHARLNHYMIITWLCIDVHFGTGSHIDLLLIIMRVVYRRPPTEINLRPLEGSIRRCLSLNLLHLFILVTLPKTKWEKEGLKSGVQEFKIRLKKKQDTFVLGAVLEKEHMSNLFMHQCFNDVLVNSVPVKMTIIILKSYSWRWK